MGRWVCYLLDYMVIDRGGQTSAQGPYVALGDPQFSAQRVVGAPSDAAGDLGGL